MPYSKADWNKKYWCILEHSKPPFWEKKMKSRDVCYFCTTNFLQGCPPSLEITTSLMRANALFWDLTPVSRMSVFFRERGGNNPLEIYAVYPAVLSFRRRQSHFWSPNVARAQNKETERQGKRDCIWELTRADTTRQGGIVRRRKTDSRTVSVSGRQRSSRWPSRQLQR